MNFFFIGNVSHSHTALGTEHFSQWLLDIFIIWDAWDFAWTEGMNGQHGGSPHDIDVGKDSQISTWQGLGWLLNAETSLHFLLGTTSCPSNCHTLYNQHKPCWHICWTTPTSSPSWTLLGSFSPVYFCASGHRLSTKDGSVLCPDGQYHLRLCWFFLVFAIMSCCICTQAMFHSHT